MRRIKHFVFAALVFTLARPAMAGGVSGATILAEVDRRAAVFADQSYRAKMEVFEGGTLKKTLEFHASMRGLEQQLIVFDAPGDVAGMKVLMQDADTLHVYLPEFKKTRRVASHVRNQGFLGSEFTYEDMTQSSLSPFFNAEFQGKTGTETTLVLTPKKGVNVSHARLVVTIDAAQGGVTKMAYFEADGSQTREQIREAWQNVGGHNVPTRIRMKNLRNGHETVVTRSDIVVNQGLEASVFSPRQLLRGGA